MMCMFDVAKKEETKRKAKEKKDIQKERKKRRSWVPAPLLLLILLILSFTALPVALSVDWTVEVSAGFSVVCICVSASVVVCMSLFMWHVLVCASVRVRVSVFVYVSMPKWIGGCHSVWSVCTYHSLAVVLFLFVFPLDIAPWLTVPFCNVYKTWHSILLLYRIGLYPMYELSSAQEKDGERWVSSTCNARQQKEQTRKSSSH